MKKLILFLVLMSMFAVSVSAATIWTDKQDYSPPEDVYVSGAGFNPNVNVIVMITRPSGAVDSGSALTNNIGEFTYFYDLDGVFGLYNVYATDNQNSATTTFTDDQGSIWDTISNCTIQQNHNYKCGEGIYLNARDLTPSKTLNYEIKDSSSGGNVVASGTVTTDSNGNILQCVLVWTVPTNYNNPNNHKIYVYDGKNQKTKVFVVACGCVDNDGDGYNGYNANSCNTGTDCNDNNASINPGAAEKCNNNIDDDCDGSIDCADSNCESDPNCQQPPQPFCGDGNIDQGEACDPNAVPDGCPQGQFCDAQCNCQQQTEPELEFGDAPDSPTNPSFNYKTLLVNDGARHIAVGPMLGILRDIEPDGQPSIGAVDDDLNGVDDEDGVFIPVVQEGQQLVITVTASAPSILDAWIDYNLNGIFDHPSELIYSGQVLQGQNQITLTAPAAGTYYARFRLSTQGGLSPAGQASDGEVEDYSFQVLTGENNPVPEFTTLGAMIGVIAIALITIFLMRRKQK